MAIWIRKRMKHKLVFGIIVSIVLLLLASPFQTTSSFAQQATGVPRILGGQLGSIASVAWSPDGKVLASAHVDQMVRLWDVSTGQLLKTLQGHTAPLTSVAWSPDGKTLASGGDTTARLWDPVAGQLLRTL